MNLQFEPTRSFCYRFARYTAIPEIEAMEEVKSGFEFRLSTLAQKVIDKYISQEEQGIKLKKEQSDRTDTLHSLVKFYVAFRVKEQKTFVAIGDGMYRATTDADISDAELDESAIEDGDETATEFDGWLYAFSFPVLVKSDGPFPIKVGKTVGSVEDRVMVQCKGSASFDNPVILGRWQVKRVGPSELAVHNVLKARGKWRENVPGTEWFDTTVQEVQSIVEFCANNRL